MALRCIAIDDEPLALELIRNYVGKMPALQLVQVFEDAISAAEFLRQSSIDLVFIDIQMPDISGLELIKSLKERPLFILTTAHKNYAYESYELEAADYLLKPISFERFARAVNKAVAVYEHQSNSKETPGDGESLFVYSEYKLIKIEMKRIIFIESLEDYIRIHINGGQPVMTLMTLKKVLEKLPPEFFQRIHRSYIVGTRYINAITHKKLVLQSGRELPVGDAYIDNIKSWFN